MNYINKVINKALTNHIKTNIKYTQVDKRRA